MKPTRLVALFWAFVTCFSLVVLSCRSAEIPVATLFSDFEFTEMELSPDGKTLAMTGPQKGHQNIALFDLESRQPRWLTKLGDREAYNIAWFGDRIVFRMSKDGIDMGAICAVDRDGSDPKILIHSIENQADGMVTYLEDVDLLARIPGDDNAVLVVRELIDRHTSARNRGTKHVHRLNLRTGQCAMEAKNPGDVVAWCADLQGKVRAAIATDGTHDRLLYRDRADLEWRTLTDWESSGPGIYPISFAADNRSLVVSATGGRDTDGAFLFDVDAKTLKAKIWQHESVDTTLIHLDQFTGAILGVGYEDERVQWNYFDPLLKAAQSVIDKALPETSNQLINLSRDRKRLLYFASSDRDPGTYYLFDVDQKRLDRLGARTDRIKPEMLSRTIGTNYLARDGLRIPSYLTFPNEREHTRLPMVVMVHGGPWVRDSWGFDREVQFFASRGYLVLQPNYRGSTGYGRRHFTAGFKQWGLKMQDDITDGVQWAIQQGLADPTRVVIFGASYGGYAAMMGLETTPGLYRCGINYVGVTDIVRLLKSIANKLPARYTAYQSTIIGDVDTERQRLEDTSPIHHVDKIRAPVFLAYGELDPRVPIQQGRGLARELKRLKKPYEMIIKKDEGHGFRLEENRIELYEAIDKFLKKHVP